MNSCYTILIDIFYGYGYVDSFDIISHESKIVLYKSDRCTDMCHGLIILLRKFVFLLVGSKRIFTNFFFGGYAWNFHV